MIQCTLRPNDCQHSRYWVTEGVATNWCGMQMPHCKYADDGSYVPRVITEGPPTSPETISYPIHINPNRCDNCGFTKINEGTEKCPVCDFILQPTEDQRRERRLKTVRWGCYKAEFHGYTLKQCETIECETCRYGG